MNTKNSALLIIDVQNDFFHPRGVFSKKGFNIIKLQKIIPNIERAISFFRSKKLPIIYIRAEYGKENLLDNIWERYKEQGLENLCLPNSFGSKFYKIFPKPNEKIFIKNRYDAFTNNDFEKYLKENKINKIFLTGVSTDVCVDSIARSAFQKGYFIVAIKDCLESIGNRKKDLNYYKRYYGAKIISSKELLKLSS